MTPIPQKKIQPPSAEREDYAFSDELEIDARSFEVLSNAIEHPPAPTPALVDLFRKR